MKSTSSFSQCVAVFEGGGVRGVAFAGAISAARNSGISFVGSVGASAGAIAAILVAAGFEDQELEELLSVDFATLLAAPERHEFIENIPRWHRSIPGNIGKAVRQLDNLGLYSSKGIEIWIDRVVKEKLGIERELVLFKDLRKPVAVISTDLTQGTYKVWSTKRTPTMAVGLAVRASCSIPFFFQPVLEGGSILVDGGVIANLPVFLVNDIGLRMDYPVLSFRLKKSCRQEKPKPKDALGFGRLIVDAMLDGHATIQLSLTNRRQVVDIDTKDVSTSDFNLSEEVKQELIENGRIAVREFVKNEQRHVASSAPQVSAPSGLREGLLEQTLDLINRAAGEICILAGDLSWLRELHVSLLFAKLNGSTIRVVCEEHQSHSFELAVQGAAAIGAEVAFASEICIKGTLIDPGTPLASMILIEDKPATHGAMYDSPQDEGLCRVSREYFENTWQHAKKISSPAEPKFVGVSEDKLIEAIRLGVPQYRHLCVSVEFIDLSKTSPLTNFLERFKIRRLEHLGIILAKAGVGLAANVVGSPWGITPPVVERLRNGELIVIDGTHRIFSALQNGLTNMRVIVVDNPNSNLPAVPAQGWTNVTVIDKKLPRAERYAHFNESNFREIRKAFEYYIE